MGGQIFFSSRSKSKLHSITTSIFPTKGANKSTLTKNLFIQVFNQYLNVDKFTILKHFQKIKILKEKKNFFFLNSEN